MVAAVILSTGQMLVILFAAIFAAICTVLFAWADMRERREDDVDRLSRARRTDLRWGLEDKDAA